MEDLGTQRFEALLAGTLANDPEVATEFFRRFHPALVRYLAAREPRHADDLEADVWLAVASHLDRFEGSEREFRAWLFTLARNVVTGHRRKGIRRRTDVVGPQAFEERAAVDGAEELALGNLATAEAMDAIRHHLTEPQAEVVRLRVIAGLTAAEVADLLGRPETWVRVTQHRALARLANRLPGRKE